MTTVQENPMDSRELFITSSPVLRLSVGVDLN